ncbi:MAG: RDD family protein [Proteobacteria bacterium]|nr:RDD family protein [Pseudomonadota bacterium]
MKNTLRRLSTCLLLAGLCGYAVAAQAHDSVVLVAQSSNRQIVSIGHNSVLPAGEKAQDVVSVMGSTTVDGDASDSAVAVMGNVTVNGAVGNGGAVAVMGNVYVNGTIDGDVVAVFGNVKLGPQALIRGQVTEILGTLESSPTAVVQGGTSSFLPVVFGNFEGMHAWVEDCLLYGRPLAPTLAIAWAWWLALAMLALHLLIAAVFRDGVQRCVQTLQTHPGPSILATIIVTLLVPVLLLALLITVVGIAVIPLFWIALICAGIFGRVVALGWLGGRCLRLANTGMASRPVLDVLAGSILVLALYMVPVLGFLVYVLLGVFGFGAVVYALLRAVRPEPARPGAGAGRPGVSTPSGPSGTGAPADAAPPASASAFGSSGAGAAASVVSPQAQMGTEPPPNGPSAAAAAPPALDVATLPRAGFWIRMLALLIDLILVAVVMGWLFDHGSSVLLVLAAYGALMWKFKGTTVGGIICDLKVVRIGGGPLDWSTAIIRALGCFLSLVVAGLGFIWIAVDREHQAWHDKIAGTLVVRVPKGAGLI